MLNEIYDLFIDLDATEDQLEFPVLYANARAGTVDARSRRARRGSRVRSSTPSSSTFRRRTARSIDPLQMLIANLDSSDYLGRIAIGRIFNGRVKHRTTWSSVAKLDGSFAADAVTKLFAFEGLKRVDVAEAAAGDIVCLAGIEDITIGETVTDPANPMPIPPIAVDEPTVSMIFGVNTSPLAGREGQFVTSRNLRERLESRARSATSRSASRTPNRPST